VKKTLYLLLILLQTFSFDSLSQSCPPLEQGPQNGCYGCGANESINEGFWTTYIIPILHAFDPNDIIGPTGYSDPRWISPNQTLDYTIRFENDPDFATGPALVVRINHPLDSNINLNTLRLSDFGFGDFLFQVPPNSTFYQETLDISDSLGVAVSVTAGIDVTRREAFWIFESLDPVTGLPPEDPLLGFLPVNDTSITRFNDTIPKPGEGFVSFSVQAKRDIAQLDSVRAQASIIFDTNEPIATNIWVNNLDPIPPTSNIVNIEETSNKVFLIETSADDGDGSGIESYDLYYSLNEGPLIPLASNMSEGTPYVFDNGIPDSTYCFVTIAHDHAGNTETFKSMSENCITLSTDYTVGLEPSQDVNITLFPIPTTGSFSIHNEGKPLPSGMLYIRDMQGKLIRQVDLNKIHSQELTIDISYAPPGVYFIYLEDGEDRWVQRIVKE